MNPSQNKPIILFDGVCNLCNTSIQLIIKKDLKEQFLFAPLQSDAGQRILLHNKLENLDFGTIILLENNKIYDKSTAALRITRRLSGGYPLLYAFVIVPKFIRDAVYKTIANNRHKWFGKQAQCMVPTASIKERFLS
tara:strand:- start:1454 stop:1864 length:411 start_codon:yes stop_codon:yes gene_type:complete